MTHPIWHRPPLRTTALLLMGVGCGARSGLLTDVFSNGVQTGGSNQVAAGNSGTQPYLGGHESTGGHTGFGTLSSIAGGTFASGGVSQIADSSATGGAASAPQAASVSVGNNYTCASLSNGTVKCWGSNISGRLGNGTTTDTAKPSLVFGLTSAAAIASGDQHACALLNDGTACCWGANDYGQLGDGTNTNSSVPVAVLGISSAVSISAGYQHTCARLSDDSAVCWGGNSNDQLGADFASLYSASKPIKITSLYYGVTAISAGRAHTCAIPELSGGAVTCWGSNSRWQLGDPTASDPSFMPVTVIGVTSASALAAGGQHNCALIAGGTVQCWGWNYYGQLGNGSTANNSAANVYGISSAKAITAADHTCALLNDGHVQCWGFNTSGELGNDTMISSPTPVPVISISNATSVSAGSVHTCALLDGGQLMCWGDNAFGELGDGTLTNSSVPVKVEF